MHGPSGFCFSSIVESGFLCFFVVLAVGVDFDDVFDEVTTINVGNLD